jgi:endo-beta-N-acetylglucosaminidase D
LTLGGEAGTTLEKAATNNLIWETNLNLNVGLEFAILNNRIKGNIEYFKRKSKDLLLMYRLLRLWESVIIRRMLEQSRIQVLNFHFSPLL